MPPPPARVAPPHQPTPTTTASVRMASAMRGRLLAAAAAAASAGGGPVRAGAGTATRRAGLASRAAAPEVATARSRAPADAAAAVDSSPTAAATTTTPARGRGRRPASPPTPTGPPTRLVIVESPAKAKKIGAYLGPGSTVLATYGHVRDLPARAGSVSPEAGFAMAWEASPRARGAVDAIAAAAGRASEVILATDPDREGEAISWHILEELKVR